MQRILRPAVVLLFVVALNAQTVPIYNSIPSPLPPSLTSQSFQAERISEFGDQVAFGGTDKRLTSVTIAMVTWGYFSKYNSPGTTNTGGWGPFPITLNLYSVNSSDPNHPGPLIRSVMQSFVIPWRPEPSLTCGTGSTMWLGPDGACHNGMAFPISFDFSSLPLLTLPDQVIFGIAYNTESAGQPPMLANGPWDDLNVGLYNATNNMVGSNPIFPEAFLNSSVSSVYADNGVVGMFRRDVGGVHTNVAIEFNAPAAPPAFITVTGGGGQSATVGTQFGNALQVKVTDAANNPSAGVTVTFAAPSGAVPSATLSATSATTDSNGVASVMATANTTAGAYAVTASVTGVTPAMFNLTNTPGLPAKFSFVQQPKDALAGAAISPAVTVQLADTYNNPISASITLTLQGGPGTLTGTLPQPTNPTGIATFNDLKVDKAGAAYSLLATVVNLPGSPTALSSPFKISANPASVAISVSDGDGQSAIVTSAYGKNLQALVHDQFQNPVANVPVTFTAPATGASVTFSGPSTVNTDSNGIATAPSMTANAQAGSVQVMATTPGASSPALFNLTNLAGTTNHLSFVQQPTDTVAGQDITPAVTVQLQDSSGNALHTPGVSVTVQANATLQQKGLFSGNATQPTDPNGLATFSNLSIAQAGRYQLLASAAGVASGTSNPFNVTAGVPSSIIATGGAQQSAVVLTVFVSPLQVTVTDAAGNPAAGVPVVFTAPASGPSGTFGGQQTFAANTDALGHAQVVITANNIAGSYVVSATSTMVAGTASFSLTNLPLASTVLKFVQQPSNTTAGLVIAPPVTVQVQNSSGGASNTAGVAIVLSLSFGTGPLLGTVVQLTDATGTATFNDLRIGAVGPKQLTATSASQPPAVSSTFQIIAGTPSTITAISGTPQSTTVSMPFPMLLQAQVRDLAGNPVGGATVSFTAPPSGPSGTFNSAATVATDSNGIATAPLLTANGTAGSFAVTASVTGAVSPAAFSLTNLPQQGSLTVIPSLLTFVSQINQPAPPGQNVQVASTGAALSWTASSSAPWITVSPSSGNTPTTASISVNPATLAAGNYSGSVVFTSSSGGTTAVLVTYTIGAKPVLVITPSTLTFTTSSTTITPPAQMLTTASSAGPISYGVTAQVATPAGETWLRVSPGSGQTVGSVQVSVDLTGLSRGIYNGSVLFTPTDVSINSVAVPITLLVACGQGGCTGLPATILSVVNAASFHPGGAPGAAMSIFGVNLADAVYQAPTFPLPTQLGPTSVTVNGSVVPLYYASPTQINFQMPAGAPATNVQIAVTNGFTRTRASQDHTSSLTAVDPGLFVTARNRAAALNQDLTVHTPETPQPAGAYIVLYLTGQGPISPPIPDGAAAPVSPLSLITGVVQVAIGGKPAQVAFAGAAPGFAGLSQINAMIPAGLAAGDQPVFISINGVSSNAGLITVK